MKKLSTVSVLVKVLMPIVLVIPLGMILVLSISLYNQNQIAIQQENDILTNLHENFVSETKVRENSALALATAFSNLEEVQNRFAAQDRQELIN